MFHNVILVDYIYMVLCPRSLLVQVPAVSRCRRIVSRYRHTVSRYRILFLTCSGHVLTGTVLFMFRIRIGFNTVPVLIRIKLFTSVRIRILGAKHMRAHVDLDPVLVRLCRHKKLEFVMKNMPFVCNMYVIPVQHTCVR
jgi:hypothetical protein